MPISNLVRRTLIATALAALASCVTPSGPQTSLTPDGIRIFPASGAANINPDTHLTLTFPAAPTIGTSGRIQIYDAADNSLVDTLDMSIPASPAPSGRSTATTEAERRTLAAQTKMEDFQHDTIGGVQFHFFPIIVRGQTATIYPHQGKLKYGRTYTVKIDPGVLTIAGAPAAAQSWTFKTKPNAPSLTATRYTVAADGSADFSTVQGAIDHLPAKPAQRTTIFIRNGAYEELVFLNDKSNLTIRGESREGVQVGYPNNSAFNPGRGGPSRRPAFSLYNASDVQLSTFTIKNHFIGQAEALLVRGERIVIDRMTLNGSGDALTTYGSIYMVDSKLTGDGDTILGYAALFCLRCEIHSIGPFTWTRTPAGQHGNVFVDSTFVRIDKPLPWTVTAANPAGTKSSGVFARLPKNGPVGAVGANFPNAEMVLINAKTELVPEEGWGPVEGPPDFDSSQVRFMEHNTTDLSGRPIAMSKRHPIVRVLTKPADAQTIANYSNPEYVLGWKPVID